MSRNAMLLKNLLTLTKDGEWGKGEPAPNHVRMRVIRGTDFERVKYGDISDVPVRYIPEHIAERKQLQPGDILLETAGGSKGQPTGRSVLLKKSLFSNSEEPLTCASFSRFLRVDESQVIPDYLYWFLQRMYCAGEMDLYQVQHTGIARFQYTQFASTVEVLLPSLGNQAEVSVILGTLDDKIELNRQMNQTLEQIAAALFRSWFIDFDPVRAKMEGRETEGIDAATAALFPERLVESNLGEIPEGWRVGTLGDIAKQRREVINPANVPTDTPYFGLEHMPRQSIALGDWGVSTDATSAKAQFEKGDILFGKLRPYFHKVGVAPVAGLCSTDILVLKPQSPALFGLVLGFAASPEVIQYSSAGSEGTRMPRVSWKYLAEFPVAVPCEKIAETFTTIVQPMVELIHSNIFENRVLSEARDALLPRLLSGELRVWSGYGEAAQDGEEISEALTRQES